ncbi:MULTISPECIES: cytochrome P460 family protein [Alphaproteobacteria]|uniref:cytochrome P460 family protein n=1 Tax=Alphaproteobacteria TaxID=28211 RepID=UPI003A942CE1
MLKFNSALKKVIGVSGVLALIATTAFAEETRVTFPENLDDLIHYTTVRRGEVTEHIKTTPEAIAAIKAGEPVPFGTHFVLEDYRNGEIYRYFIMQKGEGWGLDYDEDRRTGDWQYQWYWGDRSINMDENTARCQRCHSSQERSEYLYTGYRIPHFDGTPID